MLYRTEYTWRKANSDWVELFGADVKQKKIAKSHWGLMVASWPNVIYNIINGVKKITRTQNTSSEGGHFINSTIQLMDLNGISCFLRSFQSCGVSVCSRTNILTAHKRTIFGDDLWTQNGFCRALIKQISRNTKTITFHFGYRHTADKESVNIVDPTIIINSLTIHMWTHRRYKSKKTMIRFFFLFEL